MQNFLTFYFISIHRNSNLPRISQIWQFLRRFLQFAQRFISKMGQLKQWKKLIFLERNSYSHTLLHFKILSFASTRGASALGLPAQAHGSFFVVRLFCCASENCSHFSKDCFFADQSICKFYYAMLRWHRNSMQVLHLSFQSRFESMDEKWKSECIQNMSLFLYWVWILASD